MTLPIAQLIHEPDYRQWLVAVKQRIQSVRMRIALANPFSQRPVDQILWGHNIPIFTKSVDLKSLTTENTEEGNHG